MDQAPSTSPRFVVELWISGAESAAPEALLTVMRDAIDRMSETRRGSLVLLGMPAVSHELSPCQESPALCLRWVEIEGADPLDALSQVSGFAQRLLAFLAMGTSLAAHVKPSHRGPWIHRSAIGHETIPYEPSRIHRSMHSLSSFGVLGSAGT